MITCPNCNAELKKALFGNNQPLTQEATEFINTFTGKQAAYYCEKCGSGLLDKAKQIARSRYTQLGATLNKNIHYIPLLSLQQPTDWNYTPLGLVTGQSVTGTGVFSEFASAWTDFFGNQSATYNKKIAGGELICQTQLRLKCVELGGNAILGTDIDYAEVGGLKGMLMVCMTGTAVLLNNTEIIGAEAVEGLNIVTETAKNRRAVKRFNDIINNPGHPVLADISLVALRPGQGREAQTKAASDL